MMEPHYPNPVLTIVDMRRMENMNQQYDDHEYDDACATVSTASEGAMVDADAEHRGDENILDNDDSSIVAYSEMSDFSCWPSWTCEFLAVFGVLFLGAIAISLVIITSHPSDTYSGLPSSLSTPKNHTSDDVSNTPSNATKQQQTSPVANNFNRAKYRSEIQALLNITNAQLNNNDPHSIVSQAFDWLVYQDYVPYNYTDLPLFQRFALVMLHYSTGYWIPYRGGWGTLSGTRIPECEWVGVECDENMVVRSLQLGTVIAPTKLTGTIPHEIHWLRSLQYMLLNDNEISGELPSGLYLLQNLEVLDLSSNRLSSTLSPSMANLTKLAGLDLRNNSMVGTLPFEIGLLTDLRQLLLSGNENMTGTIPSDLGNLPILRDFLVQDTGIVGTMPDEICNLVAFGQLVNLRVDCEYINCTCCIRCF